MALWKTFAQRYYVCTDILWIWTKGPSKETSHSLYVQRMILYWMDENANGSAGILHRVLGEPYENRQDASKVYQPQKSEFLDFWVSRTAAVLCPDFCQNAQLSSTRKNDVLTNTLWWPLNVLTWGWGRSTVAIGHSYQFARQQCLLGCAIFISLSSYNQIQFWRAHAGMMKNNIFVLTFPHLCVCTSRHTDLIQKNTVLPFPHHQSRSFKISAPFLELLFLI